MKSLFPYAGGKIHAQFISIILYYLPGPLPGELKEFILNIVFPHEI